MVTARDDTRVFLEALRAHNVRSFVSDIHHHRARGGLSVETDYLLTAAPLYKHFDTAFEPFGLSKTYHDFRSLAKQLKDAADEYTTKHHLQDGLPEDAIHAARTCEVVYYLIESQHTEYLGKISFKYVEALAMHRKELINNVLEALTVRFDMTPITTAAKTISNPSHPLVEDVANLVDLFFLTDHCPVPTPLEEKGETEGEEAFAELKERKPSSVIVPLSERPTLSMAERKRDEEDLHGETEGVMMAESDTKQSALTNTHLNLGRLFGHPLVLLGGLAAGLAILRPVLNLQFRWDADVSVFFMAVAFVTGRQTAVTSAASKDFDVQQRASPTRPLMMEEPSITAPTSPQRISLRESILKSIRESFRLDDLHELDQTPSVATMPRFPEGAKLGSVTHCWSQSDPADFMVRGPNYTKDHKKVPSGDFLFPCRGADLFLTDTCPENVGRNSAMLGGKLRDVPTFIINFRLPWGVLVLYYEIPEFFIPFLRAGYEEDFDKKKLPSLQDMTPGQRTACRFLQADEVTKNKVLKIVPIVVDGPWIVRQVVGGKPAIIGKKMPITYVYQPADGRKSLYLEADLDIAASSAARSILSVVRKYTNTLTLDLGFVVQSNESDEFPENMLVGCRMRGVDPSKAPGYPASAGELFMHRQDSDASHHS